MSGLRALCGFFVAAALALHGAASMAPVDRDLTVQYGSAYQGKTIVLPLVGPLAQKQA